jgi:predicted dehydrogenase
MEQLGVGLIGSGFMGRCHAVAFRAAPGLFELPVEPRLELLADVDEQVAKAAARRLGFARSTGSWRALVEDPAVGLVDVTTPTFLHEEMVRAAIAAGKDIYCEKPLAPNAATALALVEAAKAAGIKTTVGFNYLKNPITALAREIIASGEIGELIGFRGIHAEDYMADPATPFSWRLDPANGPGAIGDLGSHVVSVARYLMGDIEAVCGESATVIAERPIAPGSSERRAVEVDDQTQALVRFTCGARGTLEASWVASGRKMQLACEIVGSRGSLAFTQERLNELKISTAGQARGREGYKTILAGPDHPAYEAFCPAPGHQLGFNDLKTIEVRDLLLGLAGESPPWPDFREAWQVQRVVDAVVTSAAEGRWVAIAEI